MILTYQFRLVPSRAQHRALEGLLESQRLLYNAALEERISGYRHGVTLTYIDQTKGLTEWRRSDAEAAAVPANLQRATLKGQCVGIDLGISTFAALSDGGLIPSLKAARRAQHRLRLAQRALARKQRGSNGRRKARAEVARCHAATTHARSTFLHEASARLVRDYDLIAVEALNVQGLARSALARDVHDASWARSISMVRYKAARAGARLIEVDPRNSSQECSDCGMAVPKGLNERWHDCPHCGLSIDRDLNAARNILGRAGVGPCLPNVAGCGKRAGGNLILDKDVRHVPWRPN